jgi:hypothetical protein
MATAAENHTASQEFLEAAHRFDIENKEWGVSDRQTPRPEWWELLAEAISEACRPQALEPYQFRAATDLVSAYLSSQQPDGRPTKELLRCWHVLQTVKPSETLPVESPTDLLSLPGMGYEQAAKMLGLPLKTIHRMAAELSKKKSGDAYDKSALDLPPGHQTPEQRDRQAAAIQTAKDWKAAISRFQARPRFGEAAADDWAPPPESVEELLSLPGMSLEQVARMHRLTTEQVAAIRDGRPLASSQYDAELTEPDLHSDLDPEIVKAEIRALRAAEPDLSDAEIAERLGVSRESVTAATKPAKSGKRK